MDPETCIKIFSIATVMALGLGVIATVCFAVASSCGRKHIVKDTRMIKIAKISAALGLFSAVAAFGSEIFLSTKEESPGAHKGLGFYITTIFLFLLLSFVFGPLDKVKKEEYKSSMWLCGLVGCCVFCFNNCATNGSCCDNEFGQCVCCGPCGDIGNLC